MARNQVRAGPLAAYALPGFLSALVHSPAASIVPTLYATDFGLSLASIGLALLISRSCDVFIDPLIGYLSDHTRGRLGRRKPWVVAGGVLTVISAWFLFAPPPHPSFLYFLIWYTAIYLAWSLIEVPHAAWAFEITRDYDERSRVLTFRTFTQGLGALSFLLLPLLPIFPTTAVTPQTLHFTAWLVAVAAPVMVAIAVLWAPASIAAERDSGYKFRDLISIVRGNRPFWLFLTGFVLNGFSGGMFGALTFLYFSNYLGLAKQFVFLMIFLAVATLAFMPLVPMVVNRVGKRQAWAGSMAIGVVILPLILLVPRSPAAVIPLLLIILPIAFANAVSAVAALSVLGDVIDYDTWRTGAKRAAVYSGLLSFVVKLNAIPGGALALLIVGLMGYQPKLGVHNAPHAILGLKIAYVIAPSVLYALSILFAWFFPIDRRRQQIIRSRLESREARAAVLAAAVAGETALGVI
ncbi:MAG TPA: MFS transporter [Caulobacteraceae bacterium]|jgi:Na+/melibiose symporter-like transporter|nr:MFS transporter [Caulobacteraceae bacterium]